MAKAAKEQLEQDALTVTADAGYSNGQQFQACEEAAITVYVPPNRSVNPGGEDFFERKDFIYEAEHDRYQCPAGKWLTLKQRHKTAPPARSNPNALALSAATSHATPMRKPLSEWSNECWPIRR
jgi:hypothetical protein